MGVRAWLAFGAIYFIWGSTYLAIKFAVAEIPPLLAVAVRHFLAGAILYAWARRGAPRPSAREWRDSFIVACLFFLIGHGTLHWAQRTVPSGVAALLIATEPIWIAIWMAIASPAARLTLRSASGLLLGLVGVALVLPRSSTSNAGSLIDGLVVVAGAAAWGLGVVVARHSVLPASATMRAGTTLLAGSALLLPAAAATGELADVRMPSPTAIGALAYLIVFGSVAAYSAYFWLLERYPPVFVATHTYVNPLVAVLLGWLLGGEPVGAGLLVGAAVVIGAIALVSDAPSSSSAREPSEAAAIELPETRQRGVSR